MSQPQLEMKKTKGIASRIMEVNVFVLLFAVLAIAAILTYVLPAGEYTRVEVNGRNVVDPSSFQLVESTPVNLMGMVNSVHTGMVEAAHIIFIVLIFGGTFGVLNATGAIEALIVTLSRKLANKEKLFIPLMMLLFGLAGAFIGMAEDAIVYIGIMVPIAIALGFDAITGVAIVIVGASVGFTAAIMNPYNVGVAQGIAELPLFSGMGFRIAVFIIMYLVSVWYIYRYAMKVKADPAYGFLGNQSRSNTGELQSEIKLTTTHKLVILALVVCYAVNIYGIIKWDWYFTEIAGIFLLLGIVAGVIGRLTANQLVDSFISGASMLMMGALVIGLARAVVVVLNEGQIMDTLLHYSVDVINQFPPALTAVGMYLLQSVISYIVPSGSGQAALTMPLMAPLSDMVGVTRQTAVLAFQMGDGISNIFTPTSSSLLAVLALAGIPFMKWVKWFTPLILMHYAIGLGAVIVAQFIGYGPF